MNSSSNLTASNSTSFDALNDHLFEIIEKILSFTPLIIIFTGLTGNTISLLIFRLNNQMSKIPSMVYLSFIAVTDTLSLFEWNLDHFLVVNFKLKYSLLAPVWCRIFIFVQFTSLEASAILLSLMSIDRFLAVISRPGSFVSKLPFNSVKSATVWSLAILVSVCLLNAHSLIFPGLYETEPESGLVTFSCYKSVDPNFKITEIWETVHVYIFAIGPFSTIILFNILLIKFGLRSNINNGSINEKLQAKKRQLTKSLLYVAFLFIVMVLPAALMFGYFPNQMKATKAGNLIIVFFDMIYFLNRAILFFTCFFTNQQFRKIFLVYLDYYMKRCRSGEKKHKSKTGGQRSDSGSTDIKP